MVAMRDRRQSRMQRKGPGGSSSARSKIDRFRITCGWYLEAQNRQLFTPRFGEVLPPFSDHRPKLHLKRFSDQQHVLTRTRGMHERVKVARYIRVSRSDQNPALQSDETQRLIDHRGWELTATYLDHGISGSKDTRPELVKMMAAARRGQFKILLVWRSDRLFRSLRHMIGTIEELAALGVDFCSVSEPFDSTTPSGRLLFHLVSAFGEFERGVLIERTKAGLDAARRRGVKIGRPRVDVDVDRALKLRATGKSLRETARLLGVGAATLHRALEKA